MRIAIIRQQYTPYGGAERFVSNALYALNRQKTISVETTLISRQWHDLPSEQTNLRLIECNPSYFPKTSTKRDKTFSAAVRDILTKESFDLTQTHERIPGCDIFRAGDGVHATWLESRKRILSPIKRLGLQLNGYHRYILETEKKLLTAPTLKAVICNSTMVKTDIHHRFGTPLDKLHVIYNGYNPMQFSPQLVRDFRSLMRQNLGLTENQFVLLFVGAGFERKGLKQAIQAIQHRTDAVLLVVGHDKRSSAYQRLADKLCPNRVHFMGPSTDVRAYYGAADAFILPTLYDPFPNVIFEAMASQLPVITTTFCGGQDMIQSGKEGFICDPLDIQALRNAVDQLSQRSFRLAAGECAYTRIAPYTTDKMADKLAALYMSLLK